MERSGRAPRRRRRLCPARRPGKALDPGCRRAGVSRRAEFPGGLFVQSIQKLRTGTLPSRRPDPGRSAVPPAVPRRRARSDPGRGQGNSAPAQRARFQKRRRRPHRQRHRAGDHRLREEGRNGAGRLRRPEIARPIASGPVIRLDARSSAPGAAKGGPHVSSNRNEPVKKQPSGAASLGAIDRPVPAGVNAAGFGSDVVADALRATDIPYIALNPGASYRGFHDSLVNYLGNERPQMLLCLHEESAVAIAHGYAKVTGTAMAAAVHSNVGLMHATMAIFNAWCDRMPMVIFGATGPVDTVHRRPWIDWIHTARDQGALVRGYTKWDDQPASPAAAYEAILRANWIANTAPRGPTYVNLDAGMQEAKLAEPFTAPDPARLMPQVTGAVAPDMLRKAADLLRGAKSPLILAGRVSRDEAAWDARVALAERLGARVLTDLKVGAAFPTDHPLHAAPPSIFLDPAAAKQLREADVVLSL